MKTCVNEIRQPPRRSDQTLELAVAHPASPGPAGAVLFGPQPFLGGDMDNNVVLALQAVLTDRDWPVLRFNYRGVGASLDVEPGRNRYEYWREVEQEGSLEAVISDGREALRRAGELFPVGLLAGYSFGAVTALALAGECAPEAALVLVAPPFGRADLAALQARRAPTLLVLAGKDELTPAPPVAELRARFPALRIAVLDQADHFLLGRERELDALLDGFLNQLSAADADAAQASSLEQA
ncbi:MAG: hypothetical protein DRQ55_14110 [Planctomycetota bacterium]|nr:MAG: hypothetical protein DRQ55_14110 [Planctomycetota bacterium]